MNFMQKLEQTSRKSDKVQYEYAIRIAQNYETVLVNQSKLLVFRKIFQQLESSFEAAHTQLQQQKLLAKKQRKQLMVLVDLRRNLSLNLHNVDQQFQFNIRLNKFQHLLVIRPGETDFQVIYQQLLMYLDSHSQKLQSIYNLVCDRCETYYLNMFQRLIQQFHEKFTYFCRLIDDSFDLQDFCTQCILLQQDSFQELRQNMYGLQQFVSLQDYLDFRNTIVQLICFKFVKLFHSFIYKKILVERKKIRLVLPYSILKKCWGLTSDETFSLILNNSRISHMFQQEGFLRFRSLATFLIELLLFEETQVQSLFNVPQLLINNVNMSLICQQILILFPTLSISDLANSLKLIQKISTNLVANHSVCSSLCFQIKQLLTNQLLKEIATDFDWFFPMFLINDLVQPLVRTNNSLLIFQFFSNHQCQQPLQFQVFVNRSVLNIDKQLYGQLFILLDLCKQLENVSSLDILSQQIMNFLQQVIPSGYKLLQYWYDH